MPTQSPLTKPYDAFLLVSFGGPEGMPDVIPFLENVLRGKNVPAERMHAVAHHYELFNGISPINEQNRQLIAALKPKIELAGPKLPIYWGNRNWHPLLTDTVRQMANDGIKKAIAFVTSGYSSYSSCRQYLENIEQARINVGDNAPKIDKIRPFYNHPGFIAANSDQLLIALGSLTSECRQNAQIIFTAHSIPMSMAEGCRYAEQLIETARLVISEAKVKNQWQLAYQSRSGPANQPWLEPDINDCIRQLAQQGIKNIVVAPLGFVSDHMEIIYDLDTEAQQLCETLSITYRRAKTASCHPKFINMITNLVEEQIACQSDLQDIKSSQDFCAVDCCRYTPARPLSKPVSTTA
jgi:ferrochelatase